MNGIIILKDQDKLYYSSKYEIEALMPFSNNMELYNILYCLDETIIDKIEEDKYLVTIYTDLKDTFENLTSKDKKEHIISEYQKNRFYKLYPNELQSIMNRYKGHEEDLLTESEVIVLDFDINKSVHYLEANKELHNKKIVINASIYDDFDKKEVSEIIKNIPNLYIKIEQNSELITFEEFTKTKEIIDNTVKEIESFNFSPLEQIMYAYDIAKDHIYKKESEEENENASRNLTSVLLGDKIVCVGYAEIFNTILNKLGIKSNVIALNNKEKEAGHAINVVYVKDEKYNIDGVYYFDATADRKLKDNSNLHMLKYKYFAKTLKEISILEKGFIDQKTNSLKPFIYHPTVEEATTDIKNCISELILYYEIMKNENFLKKLMNLIRSINYISELTGNPQEKIKTMVTFKEGRELLLDTLNSEVKSKINNNLEYIMKPINTNIMIETLYNVRKQQYYNNPKKYPFSKEDFLEVLHNSNWFFDETINDFRNQKLENDDVPAKQEQLFYEYLENSTLERDIGRVRLVRTLKSISNKK